jgi:hypothetical protein
MMLRTALIAGLLAASAAAPALAGDFQPFDPVRHSQAVTQCDRLAAHPDDPFRVTDGVSQSNVQVEAAIAACREAVAKDPGNPRLNYQLARVLGYSGQGELAIPHRAAAVEADYPQALFVVGFITLHGMNKQPQDACRAGELIRRSAQQGRMAGQVGFVRYAQQGLFDGCSVRRDPGEMRDFLAAARKQAGGDYYQGLLIDVLEERLGAAR